LLRSRPFALLATLAALTVSLSFVPSASADEDEEEVPDFVRQFPHGDIEQNPHFRQDAALQHRLQDAVTSMGLDPLVKTGKCGVAIVDLTDVDHPVLADVRGSSMIYAASIPKIGALYAAFQARKEGRLVIDDQFRETMTQMCRVSSNQAATATIMKVGFPYIASVLWESGLYDPSTGGGLWVGKAYGGADDHWRRDPVANLSHGASAISLAKLLTLLAQGRLVDEQSSHEMLDILGNPGLHHKFVRGLDSRPSTIYRKSGSWSLWHGDAALIERADKRYVAVCLLESPQGEDILSQLILRLDDCIECHAPADKMASAAATTTTTTAVR
jgi:beta-lactamase class A